MTAQGLIGLVCKEFLQTNLKTTKVKNRQQAKAIHEGNVSQKSKVLDGFS